MNTDQEWARELFERSRQGEEPVWVADHTEMMRTGQRKNRVRALTASGSVVVTAAVVAAVGIGVSGGVDQKTHVPGPGQGTGPAKPSNTPVAVAMDPSDVLTYAAFNGFSTRDDKSQDRDFFHKYYIAVPSTTARDTAQLLSRLDPTLAHIAKTVPPTTPGSARLVSDDDPMAKDMAMVRAGVAWTDDGSPAASLRSPQATAPMGTLDMSFVDSADEGPDQADICTMLASGTSMLDPVQVDGNGWTDGVKFSPCAKKTLPDGSVLLSTTKSYGPFVAVSVVRQFPNDGGAMGIEWENFAPTTFSMTSGPDPKRALKPDPLPLDKLMAAMSDPGLAAPLAPVAVPPPPTNLLQASDFGPGWTFEPASSHATTGDLVVDNGCVNEQNPVASPQTIYGFAGKTPSGISVTASVGVDVMASGTGAKWMGDLRQHGSGGCDVAGLPYSKDTMSPLPAGTGDDAFVENWYGQGSETFFVRFGDQILRVDVKTADQKMPGFTQADKDWFAGLAAKAAVRHDGKG
ncbi:hypothetical protein KGQ20_26245 [Catenulispora sp. NF23]|uniref:hypothetical protein n=1 Tax=Catenulispora pinistramenti TaxID=2705254 RepID=UPI001BAC4B83|nr:hypothetical protein [Catenulispora pinistramenti]MBS2536270.1 hypothetical protein [Catenulispora pinistramenti]